MRSETSLESAINRPVPRAWRRRCDALVIKTYLTVSGPRSASRDEGGEAEQEATPDIKLLHLSASPAVTPDLQEPSAPLVFSRRLKTSRSIRIRHTKRPQEQAAEAEVSCQTGGTVKTAFCFFFLFPAGYMLRSDV